MPCTSLPLLGAHNLSDDELPLAALQVLNLGLRFRPTPPPLRRAQLEAGLDRLERLLRLHCCFGNNGSAPRYRVPNPNWQPPEAPPRVAAFLARVRAALGSRLRKLEAAPPAPSNLAAAERTALAAMPPPGFIIKPADKNLGLTIMRAADYRAALLTHAQDPAVYVDVTSTLDVVLSAAEAALRAAVRAGSVEYGSGVFDRKLGLYLTSGVFNRTPPYLYGMPKLHSMVTPAQRPIPLRPIAAAHSFITTPASIYLADVLNGLLPQYPTILPDRDTLARELAALRVPHDAWLVTFDVVSLYPSLDFPGCLLACRFALERGGAYTAGQISALLSLLQFVLTTSVVTVGDRHYRQVRGGAMGTNCMPPVAQLFMAVLIELPLRALLGPAFPTVYRRFIDDGFVILPGTEAYVRAFLARLNSAHPNIKLTFTLSQHSVSFMDLVINKRHSDAFVHTTALVRLDTRTHQKARNRYLYIPWHSFHSESMLLSFIHGELHRYARTCSHPAWYACLCELFLHRLLRRGYPLAVLQRAFARVEYAAARAAFLAPPVGGADDAPRAPPVLVLPYASLVPELHVGRALHAEYAAGGPKLQALVPCPRAAFQRTPNVAGKVTRASHF